MQGRNEARQRIDYGISAQLVRRLVTISVGCDDDWHVCRPCRCNIVRAIANKHEPLGLARRFGSKNGVRRRFCKELAVWAFAQAVAADYRHETLSQSQLRKNVFREVFELVGHDGDLHAECLERVQSFNRVRVGLRKDSVVF